MATGTSVLPFQYVFPSRVDTGANGQVALDWPPGLAPFGSQAQVTLNEAAATVQLRPGAFSPGECAQIMALGDALPATTAGTEDRENYYRVSKIAWIEASEQSHWLFHRMGLLFREVNAHYGFELFGLVDALQYTVYGPGQRFDWHMDLGPAQTSARKLSITVQLCDGADYDGGDLEFLNAPRPESPGAAVHPARQRGTATIFPSYVAHRVSPVTRGTRISLVAWACGPAFR